MIVACTIKKSLTAWATVVIALAALVFALPAHAADPTFPTGSRVGLVPPAGMTVSKRFSGYEDIDKDAAIIIATLPAAAYDELDHTAVPDVLKKQGITMENREPIQINGAKAFLILGTEDVDKTQYRKWILVAIEDDVTALVNVQVPVQDTTYTDTVVRAALATLTVRDTVPDAERLSMLPFKVGDLAGFKIQGVLPGRALMLADLSPDTGSVASAQTLNARLLIAAEQGGPDESEDHGNFARLAFDAIGGIKDVRINMSEPLNLDGQQGYQTMAQAKEIHSDAALMVVQWLRFGAGGFMQMVGIARPDDWTTVLNRMRTVRDSIEPK